MAQKILHLKKNCLIAALCSGRSLGGGGGGWIKNLPALPTNPIITLLRKLAEDFLPFKRVFFEKGIIVKLRKV